MDDTKRFKCNAKIVNIIKNDSDEKKEANPRKIHKILYERFKSKFFKDGKKMKIEPFSGHPRELNVEIKDLR